METTKILIVDDHKNVRQSLGTILGLIDDFEVLGEASDGAEAIRLAAELKPDVVLMDMSMSELDGTAATRNIKGSNPRIGVLMLTMHGSQTARHQAFAAGVDAFVEKGITMDELADSIRRVKRTRETMKRTKQCCTRKQGMEPGWGRCPVEADRDRPASPRYLPPHRLPAAWSSSRGTRDCWQPWWCSFTRALPTAA
ncbi:MAG: response regulator transcription factor [Spirochaetales bacterium]|nr:response regulator transcription factor [Spirochaetales bacterium]